MPERDLPNGVRLHWREAGHPAKPPVVWIHGGSIEDSSSMVTDLEPFAEKWCRATERERWEQRMSSTMEEMQAFYDANRNGVYDAGVDVVLGEGQTGDTLVVNATVQVSIPLSGALPFRELFAPALRYATEGYVVLPVTARSWATWPRSFIPPSSASPVRRCSPRRVGCRTARWIWPISS